MLNNTGVDALQSSGSGARIQPDNDPALAKGIDTYLNLKTALVVCMAAAST